jgi:hypothetical protein
MLMVFLARSGQRHVALAQFEICRRFLREELECDPSAETVAVYDELKNGGMVSNNLPTQAIALIGREAETELLIERAAAGDSRLISIVGPPGSGKTPGPGSRQRVRRDGAAERESALPRRRVRRHADETTPRAVARPDRARARLT